MEYQQPTPTENRRAPEGFRFSTLTDALDHAARGETGFNFYDGHLRLRAVLPYADLASRARAMARHLAGLKLPRGARVALVAQTGPEFPVLFFACQYAGLVPVPLPSSIPLGGGKAWTGRLHSLLRSSRASVLVAPPGLLPLAAEASGDLAFLFLGDPESLSEIAALPTPPEPLRPEETAYLQYTSGSTRTPRGVMITGEAVMFNLAGIIEHGLQVRPGDRCASWLPFFHDMGLVGFLLAPVAAGLSVDFLDTRDFAVRPRLWLNLMSRNRTTIAFSPPFGYDLCGRRIRPEDVDAFSLHSWRIAGVGAEMVRPEILERFATLLAPAGFDRRAFVASYGMAECSLAISFSPLNRGLRIDRVRADRLTAEGRADPGPADGTDKRRQSFVACGPPLPGHEVQVRGADGTPLPERCCGTFYVHGPSVMRGYFDDDDATAEVLSPEGWLNTGDIGYRLEGELVITGREKDLIIVHGRNIWPLDLETLAEQEPGIRPGDASAVSIPMAQGQEKAVLILQCRENAEERRNELVLRLRQRILEEVGIECEIELVPPHTLPRTSSGKLSRSQARRDYLQRQQSAHQRPPSPDRDEVLDTGSRHALS